MGNRFDTRSNLEVFGASFSREGIVTKGEEERIRKENGRARRQLCLIDYRSRETRGVLYTEE